VERARRGAVSPATPRISLMELATPLLSLTPYLVLLGLLLLIPTSR
jgi:hypothetical protein